jgi:Inositol polyphosphate kinase
VVSVTAAAHRGTLMDENFLFPDSSLLLVYEGKDAESDRLEASHYDADISNCSADFTTHDSNHQCSSNDENDCGIGHEDESNEDHCLYEDDGRRPPHLGSSDDIEKNPKSTKYSGTPDNRAVSPHSMDSWLNYSNSSDEYSSQDLIVHKGTKLNLHDDEETNDTADINVYDKINFIEATSLTSFKKSKIDEASCNNVKSHHLMPFQFPSSAKSSNVLVNRLGLHDTDDGIEVELEEEDDDGQLSSLSSNIDTIIMSDAIDTKFFESSGEQKDQPSSKKKKSIDQKEKVVQTNGSHSTKSSPMVDVRIIDFAHTTFTNLKSASDNMPSPRISSKKVHHGPDGGFLTGIESLKRILTEIINESSQV